MGYSTIANPGPELDRSSFDVGGGSRWARWRRQMWKLPYGLELKPGATAELKPGETVKGPYAQDERAVPIDFEVEHIKGMESGPFEQP